MNVFAVIIFGVSITILSNNCYANVIADEQTQGNNSQVKTFVKQAVRNWFSKVWQPEQQNEIETKPSRKLWPNYKRFAIKNRADGEERRSPSFSPPNLPPKLLNQNLDSVIVSLDTGAKYDPPPNRDEPDAFDRLEEVLRAVTLNPNNPIYRAQAAYNIRPQVIHLNSNQPSLKFDINSKSIVTALSDLLSSPVVNGFADVAGQKAAVVYRTIRDEMNRRLNMPDRNK